MTIFFEFEGRPLIFDDPVDLVACSRLSEIPGCFAQAEKALAAGFYLAGFISYEAGHGFEPSLAAKKDLDFPLIYLGVYQKPLTTSPQIRNNLPPVRKDAALALKINGLNTPQPVYWENIRRIKDHIARGDVYQITYCWKIDFEFGGDPWQLYQKLLKEQPVPYPAYIESPDFTILSLSPEMFLKKIGDQIITKPMKGTWPRGKNIWQDVWAGRRLHLDPKNRAENVMIADLLRNDLGRIGTGVKTPKLFEVARYKTLYQMTSTVTARIDPNIGLYKLFKALHPSGSVTGAPKIRAMEIIRDIEKEERRIYTGAIGYITPNKDMFFNVPIRTLLIRKGQGEMGIGGGIVWDSTPEGEWAEGLLKARFLSSMDPRFRGDDTLVIPRE